MYNLWKKVISIEELDFIYEFCAQTLTATESPRRLWEELGGTEFDHRRQNHILKRILPAIQPHSRGQPHIFSMLPANTKLSNRQLLLGEDREGGIE